MAPDSPGSERLTAGEGIGDGLDVHTVVAAAFGYVAQVAVPVAGGVQWLESDGRPYDDLYSGTAGVLFAAAEAIAAAGPVPAVIAAAEPARDRLLYLAERADNGSLLPDDGLFSGWAGLPVALQAWGRAHAADAERSHAAAQEIRRHVVGRARFTPPGGQVDVICGHAGVVLALLDCVPLAGAAPVGAAEDDPALTRLAQLLVDAGSRTNDGLHWPMTGNGYVSLGLSHGTAGIAYALAVVAEHLHRPDLLEVAKEAARGLIAVADQPDGWALPVRIPPRGRGQLPVMFGWCHGVAGTIRLFGLLNTIDPQPEWPRAIEAGLRALRASRLPERLFPGYWDNVGRCCGTASVGQLLTQLAISSGDRGLVNWAQQLARDLLDRTQLRNSADGQTLACWSNTDYQAAQPELPPEAGLMQGAAGIAAWLATQHASATGRAASLVGPSWI